jgi:hypothetical protein
MEGSGRFHPFFGFLEGILRVSPSLRSASLGGSDGTLLQLIRIVSDDDLKRLYSQQSAPQTNPLSSMSDDDLKALYARQQPAPASENASPSLWNRITSALSTPQAQKDAFNARDPRLAQAAQWQGTTPEALGRQNEASAGEFLKGVPVASAAVPQTPDMTKYEQEHPTGAAVWKGAGRLAALAPVMAAAPEVLGAGAGQGLAARTAIGAGSNAAIEGGDTYANTGDVNKSLEAAKNAAITAGPYDFSVSGFADWKLSWLNGGVAQNPWQPTLTLTRGQKASST